MIDEADYASDMMEHRMTVTLNNRVRYIGKSRETCESCGNEIPAERQKALPGVKHCIACAEFDESQSRQHVRR